MNTTKIFKIFLKLKAQEISKIIRFSETFRIVVAYLIIVVAYLIWLFFANSIIGIIGNAIVIASVYILLSIILMGVIVATKNFIKWIHSNWEKAKHIANNS